MPDPKLHKETIHSILTQAGFEKVRFAAAHKLEEDNLSLWLARGYSGSMDWMKKRSDVRLDPDRLFPGVQTVISLALPYLSVTQKTEKIDGLSRYAQGTDYHKVIRKKLKACINEINETISEEFRARIIVDTAPLMEKYWAVASGIGWQGKNSNVISQKMGSYFF